MPIASAVPPLTRQPTLADGVVASVRQMVHSGDLVPGQLYSVYQLAELLQVSRSPVREGLLKLAAAGAVRFERNRGFRVLVPDPRDIAEIFAVRITLEAAAVSALARRASAEDVAEIRDAWRRLGNAAEEADEDSFWEADLAFHDLLLLRSGNRRAGHIVRELRDATRLIGAGTTTASRSLRRIADEHKPIVTAVRAADAAAAATVMRDHLTRTALTLVAQSMAMPVDSAEVRTLWQEVSAQ